MCPMTTKRRTFSPEFQQEAIARFLEVVPLPSLPHPCRWDAYVSNEAIE